MTVCTWAQRGIASVLGRQQSRLASVTDGSERHGVRFPSAFAFVGHRDSRPLARAPFERSLLPFVLLLHCTLSVYVSAVDSSGLRGVCYGVAENFLALSKKRISDGNTSIASAVAGAWSQGPWTGVPCSSTFWTGSRAVAQPGALPTLAAALRPSSALRKVIAASCGA